MLKQLLIGSAVFASLLADSVTAEARPKVSLLQDQVQEAPSTTLVPDGSITSPKSDNATTTPTVNDSMTNPNSDSSTTNPAPNVTVPNLDFNDSINSYNRTNFNTTVCEFIPPSRPTGGATRQRLEALRQCN